MNIQTKITQLFDIKFPLVQGGLQGLGTSNLVSAVSEAGGLGLITAGSYENKKDMQKDIEIVRKKTSKPFGVNIAIGIRRPMGDFIEGVIESEIPIVFTSGNNPQQYMDELKAKGIIVVHVAPNIRFAQKAESLGCDAVVIHGFEGGGHLGLDDTTSLILIQKAVKELTIPVIAAGGFSTGGSMLSALSLGAEAVQMGTQFLMAEETQLHKSIKEDLLHAKEIDTIIVKKSINRHNRVWKSNHSLNLKNMEDKGATLKEIFPLISGESYKKMIEKGTIYPSILSLGQTIGIINELKPVRKIIEDIMHEFESAYKRIDGFIQEK